MSDMNVTTTKDVASAIPQHHLGGKKKKFIILPDGTKLSQEEYEQLDDRHYWEAPKKGKLGQNRK